ncbi:DNA gyrase inhibitor YacG [Burkholderiaceae bacterium DAT-1]|nr:DNA gyrase inhibitor YacG [Burkholderiaceae bacterium DAT-1]
MRTIPCPHCKKETPFSPSNPYRPFCSPQCKTHDLAAWATDQYVVSTPVHDEQLLPLADDPSSDRH